VVTESVLSGLQPACHLHGVQLIYYQLRRNALNLLSGIYLVALAPFIFRQAPDGCGATDPVFRRESFGKSILEARELHSLLIARITLTFGICTGGVMSEVRRRLLYVDS
jgi:hypothetical protein